MIILGIETSCDETSAAVIRINKDRDSFEVLSNTISTSLSLHAKTGGIIPEAAAREQSKFIWPVLKEALSPLSNSVQDSLNFVDAVACTYGPGLIGSLLVGVETARTISMIQQIPLIPVNHMYGHIYANWLTPHQEIVFPALALVVSGGHTDLLLLESHTEWKVIGGTRDDAAGEAFDKIGRLLNLPYPAGPIISRLAEKGDPKAFTLPRPMIGSPDYDFSFSGLKTAALTLVKKNNWDFSNQDFAQKNEQLLADLCASVQYTIIDVLTKKTLRAAKEFQVSSILLGGGVAANTFLQKTLQEKTLEQLPEATLFIPKREFCTDNAAMIAAAAYFQNTSTPWEEVTADPELYY